MENASKALLIAGAILIVILLIGVGMLIYNSATGSIDEGADQGEIMETQMQSVEIEGKLQEAVQSLQD